MLHTNLWQYPDACLCHLAYISISVKARARRRKGRTAVQQIKIQFSGALKGILDILKPPEYRLTHEDILMAEKHVVIAVDNARACKAAIDWATSNLGKDTEFDILHVQTRARPYMVGNMEAAFWVYDDQKARDKDMSKVTEEFLKKEFLPRATSQGAKNVHATVLHSALDDSGSVGNTICDYVEKHKPSVLVMAKENKSAVARFFVGSVIRYCSVHSKVPVVIVPPGEKPAEKAPIT